MDWMKQTVNNCYKCPLCNLDHEADFYQVVNMPTQVEKIAYCKNILRYTIHNAGDVLEHYEGKTRPDWCPLKQYALILVGGKNDLG